MTAVDIVFPASSRPEFTAASLRALARNTNWSLVRRLIIYTDGAPLRNGMIAPPPIPIELLDYDKNHYGGPVAIMNEWLRIVAQDAGDPVMAKIDNDVVVPPRWLEAALGVLEDQPGLHILGLEPPASRTAAPWARGKIEVAPEYFPEKYVQRIPRGLATAFPRGYAPCSAIGGVGLMRRSAFAGRPRLVPNGTYGGFTNWQQEQRTLVKGWIVPPLRLFLLDRLPIEPWRSLSLRYIAAGEQRAWTNYTPDLEADLWGWWDDR